MGEGGLHGEHNVHLIDCSSVCRPIRQGGLGIRKLLSSNHALQGKSLWQHGLDMESL